MGVRNKTFDSHVGILDLHRKLRTFSVFGSCYLLYLRSRVYTWGSGISSVELIKRIFFLHLGRFESLIYQLINHLARYLVIPLYNYLGQTDLFIVP